MLLGFLQWSSSTQHHQFATTLDILSCRRPPKYPPLLVSTTVYLPKKTCKTIITKPTGHRLHRSVLPRPPRASCPDGHLREHRQMIHRLHGAVSSNLPQKVNSRILWHIGVRIEAVRHGHHPVATSEAAPMPMNSKIEETLSENTTDSQPRLASLHLSRHSCRQTAD